MADPDTVTEVIAPSERVEVSAQPQVDGQQEELQRRYDQEATLGRNLFDLAAERMNKRLTPYINPNRVPKDLLGGISVRSPESPFVTEDEIGAARAASFGIVLELAAQAAEVHIPRSAPVREDLDSLTALHTGFRKGEGLRRELLESNRA